MPRDPLRLFFGTLRFKLAAINLLVFGVILTASALTLLTVFERHIRGDFDERMIDRAQRMVESIQIGPAEPLALEQRKADRIRVNPFRFPGYYFQLRNARGEVIERSANLGKVELPLSAAARAARQEKAPVLETDSGELARALLGAAGEVRLLTLYHKPRGLEAFYLQMANNLASVNNSIAELRRLLLVLIPVGVLAVGGASWLMARRALRPIGRIARQAQALTADRLDQRIDVPPGHDEVAEMVQTMNRMLDRLEAAFRAQERFVADASHEMKTPITVLMGEAQVMNRQTRSLDEYAQFVASVEGEMRNLGKLVDSLLTLARSDAGFPLSGRMPVSINEVVTDAVQRCQAFARQRGVRLVPVLAMPGPDTAEPQTAGDGALLRSMVENIIRNAVRYSPADEAVEVKVLTDANSSTIAVLDRGPGILPEHTERVFERFYRIPGDEPCSQGTGLGLAIAKGVAQLHHGQIGVRNRPDRGCEFFVKLPLNGESAGG